LKSPVKYSICIPNLNMANTIERALRSVLDQIDDRFEVIVVDDGSKDKSVRILRRLEREYPNLSVFELERDKNRTLAQTRNISISYARGEYLILHIDCDDYWHPYIKDFVLVYHQIEKIKGPNFLLSGQQINMGNAQFLRSHGPYQNGHMVEDRDMWYRLAKIGAYIPLDHVVFRDRMELRKTQRFKKLVFLTTRILRDEFRSGRRPKSVFVDFFSGAHSTSRKYRLFKVFLLPFAWTDAKLKGKLPPHGSNLEWPRLKHEAWAKSGTARDLFLKQGKSFDDSELSEIGKFIFANTSKNLLLKASSGEY
jgi:glycosyltransferase involved in cell wall biosynthesis